MKKILFLLFASVSFLACSSDDGTTPPVTGGNNFIMSLSGSIQKELAK